MKIKELHRLSKSQLKLIIQKICEFIKEKDGVSEYKKIVKKIHFNILNQEINELTPYHIHDLCNVSDTSFELEGSEINIYKGFSNDRFCNQVILTFWSEKIKNFKTFKIYCFRGLLTSRNLKTKDISNEKALYVLDYHSESGQGKIINFPVTEEYKFNIRMPLLQKDLSIDFQDSRKIREKEKDFYAGQNLTDNYLGNLMLGFNIIYLPIFFNNFSYFHSLLTSKDLQNIFSNKIITFKKLFEFIKTHHSKKRTFQIPIQNNLKRVLQQFLNFFPEFVEKAKGQKIRFEVLKRAEHLQIEIWANDEKDVDDIAAYLEEFINLVKQDPKHLKIEVESNISPRDFDILLLELKQQLMNVNHSMEILNLKNSHLEKELAEIKTAFQNTKLPPIKLSHQEFKEKILNDLGNSKVDACLKELKAHFQTHPELQASQQLIRIMARYRDCELNMASIDFETRGRIQDEIIRQVIGLVEEYL